MKGGGLGADEFKAGSTHELRPCNFNATPRRKIAKRIPKSLIDEVAARRGLHVAVYKRQPSESGRQRHMNVDTA